MRPRWHNLPQAIVDAVLVTLALYTAFLIRFEFSVPVEDWQLLQRFILAVVLIKIGTFFLNGLYDRMWRYFSIRELNVLIRSIVISSLVIVVLLYFIVRTDFPRSVIAIDAALTLLFIGGARFAVRSTYEGRKHRGILAGSKPVLVFGAGDAGEMIVREMLKHTDMDYDPVGFVDDDSGKRGKRIHGVEVLGTRDDIPHLVERYEVQEVIIAIPSAESVVIREALDLCDKANVTAKTLPGVFELIDGRVELSQIRDVNVEDLLGREPVKIDLIEAETYLKDATVLITGAGGSIGSELGRQIARFEPGQIILLDHNENGIYRLGVEFKTKFPEMDFKSVIGDIKDIGLLDQVFEELKPQVVFHAAAHKHVPLMEENPWSAVYNNVIGSKNMIEVADRHNIDRFVLISTDKAVDPTGIMGTTKRLSEMVLQSKAKSSTTRFMAVRFGNVIGSDASVAPIFRKQIEEGGPVTVTHPDIKRYFMSISEATQLVLQAGAIGGDGEILMLDMGEPVKIIDLARNLIRLSGLDPDKDIEIKIIGLRNGDEMSEDIVGHNEELIRTKQDKVFIVSSNGFDRDKFAQDLEKLEQLIFSNEEADRINERMSFMVPSYKVKTSLKSRSL